MILDWSQKNDINPSKAESNVVEDDDTLSDQELDSGIEDIEIVNARKGRQNNNIFNFLLYWITTTSTSTSTTFTRTKTLTLSAGNGDQYCIPDLASSSCMAG